jgi:hypothetical protein
MSNFDRRHRNSIFFLVLALGLVPGGLAFLSTPVGISPRDPQFLDADYHAEFKTGKGLSDFNPIVMRSEAGKKLAIKQSGREEGFVFTPEGTYVKDGKDTGTYPVLWVRFPPQEKMTRRDTFSKLINQLKVTDLTGLIGPKGEVYRLHNETTTILWSWTLGSQFSHPVELIDAKGDVAASGIYDTTCGILEEMSVYKDGALGTIALTETDFPMSRNRNFSIVYVFIVAGIILLYHFIWRRKRISDPVVFRLDTDLLILGVIAVFLDVYVDIWFFHVTGPWVLVILHLAAAGFVLWRFGFWVVFPLLELYWAGSLAIASQSINPQLAMCPALIITWFGILQFQSFKKRL